MRLQSQSGVFGKLTAMIGLALMAAGTHVLAASSNPAAASTAASTYVPDKNKVLRYAFEVAESSMDPQKVSDVYSTIVHNAIFDTPLRYDYLA
jgi:ABC-type oligopeptide transport system substrate-binding subunit